MTFAEMIYRIDAYFKERGIDTKGFTLIFNFQHTNPAVGFEVSLQRELSELLTAAPAEPLDIRKFTMRGITVRVESPIHEGAEKAE